MSKVLTLNVKCGGDIKQVSCNCKRSSAFGITVKKETDDSILNVTGFLALVHSPNKGRTFWLSNKLDNDETLGDAQVIYGITKVLVYYWKGDENYERPLLLELDIDSNNKNKYYYKYDQSEGPTPTIWKLIPDKLTLQERLDDRNCGRNNAIVFNIKNSSTGGLPSNSKSDCIKTRKIELLTNSKLSGSDYVTTEYITDDLYGRTFSTRISRVTYNDNPTDINLNNNGPVSQIRLYSYPGSADVPLMLEFKPPDNGTSRWFHSKNINPHGTKWQEVYDTGDRFYHRGSSTPKAALSKQLDEVLCFQYGNVTLNLTKGVSTDQNKYCCEQHKGGYKASVSEVEVRCAQHGHGSNKLTAYKHSVEGGKLAGIYYNDGEDQRERKNLSGLWFPMDGVNGVYVFYCEGNGPSLIYIDSGIPAARGWYENGENGQWKWISELSGIKNTDIENGLSCVKWNKLRKYLKGPGCSGLTECSYGNDNEQIQYEEKELAEEAEKAEAERQKAIDEAKQQNQQPPVPAPVVPPGNGNSGSFGGGRSGSGGSVDPSSSQTQLQIIAQQDPGVTIKLNVKPNYGDHSTKEYDASSGTKSITIKVIRSPYPNPSQGSTGETDFFKFTHTSTVSFSLKEVKDDNSSHIAQIKRGQNVSLVTAYYWRHDNGSDPPKNALLVEIQDNRGNYTYCAKRNGNWESYSIKTPGEPTQAELELLNCEINNVIQIDVTKTEGEYCHDGNTKDKHDTKKVKVSKIVNGKLGNYTAYGHTPNEATYTGGKSFNISGFRNGHNGVRLEGLSLPIRDVTRLIVYMCEKYQKKTPLLIYYSKITGYVPSITYHWYQNNTPGNGNGEWKKVEDTPSIMDYSKILDILDRVGSLCKPPSVTIDIYDRSIVIKKTYYDDTFKNFIDVNGTQTSGALDFTEYTHTVQGRKDSYFTLNGLKYDGAQTRSFETSVKNVKAVSVYYWSYLEQPYKDGDQRGRPLLVKVTTQEITGGFTETYYENKGDSGETNWKHTVIHGQLEAKLYLLNCKLNNAVIIDLGKNKDKETYDACYEEDQKRSYKLWDPSHGERMQVSRNKIDTDNLKHYQVYNHTVNRGHGPFHILKFVDGIGTALNIGGTPSSPILDVDLVKVYRCDKDNKSLLIFYKRNTWEGTYEYHWYKNDKSGSWPVVTEGSIHSTYNDREIQEVLDKLESKCKPAAPVTVPPSPVDAQGEATPPQEPAQQQTQQPPSAPPPPPLAGSEGATATKGEALARSVSASGRGKDSQTNSSTNDWKVIFGGSASATVVSGSLTGFGWWMFKRSKGDPWVRQI